MTTGDIALPVDSQKMSSADGPAIIAAFTRAVLAGDYSVCENKAVATWVAIGAKNPDGAGVCRASLTDSRKLGSFTVSDPATGETASVSLP